MEAKLAQLWPEIALFITTCFVMVLGLSPDRAIRKMCAPFCGLGLIVAGLLAWYMTPAGNTALPFLPQYAKLLVAGIGLILLFLVAGTADRDFEAAIERGAKFEALRATRGEFYSFFLFSLTGLMLCASSDDLIFLFLALELTSLPTYVMVSLSTARNRSMEAGVKYFFLGALGAAIFLYGFALIYGGTGHTDLAGIRANIQTSGLNTLTLVGLVLSIVGICFKIAAVPMHFYTPDVYQGSSASIAGFLAFVPKSAGFFAILLLTSTSLGAGNAPDSHSLPLTLHSLLWIIAVFTMTIGNVLAILQTSVKRILAYSSIAHSGYMLVGIVAGPGLPIRGSDTAQAFSRNGFAAVLFYLAVYGVTTLGAFAVLSCLEKRGPDGTLEESDDINDIRGLCTTRPLLGWIMVISASGLLGLPPLLGFLGKLPLFTAGIRAGEIPLVLILGVNSAIAAFYYLRLVAYPLLEKPETAPNAPPVTLTPFRARRVAGFISATAIVVLALIGSPLSEAASKAATVRTSGTRATAESLATPANDNRAAVHQE